MLTISDGHSFGPREGASKSVFDGTVIFSPAGRGVTLADAWPHDLSVWLAEALLPGKDAAYHGGEVDRVRITVERL